MFVMKQKASQMVADWKGNIIKPGDEVCVITVKRRPYFSNLSLIVPCDPLPPKEYTSGETEETECWEVGPYYKVDQNLCVESAAGEYRLFKRVKDLLCDMLPGYEILAIKGVSDHNSKIILL